MKTNSVLALLLVCFVSDAVSANAGEQGPVYPEYKANETLVFRSGSWTREGKELTFHRDKFGVVHYRIPDLSRMTDGRLVATVVCRCSKDGDSADSTSFFAVSKDEGKTWEKITFNTGYENEDSRPATDFPLTERTQETQLVWYPAMKKFVAVYLTNAKAWFTTSTDLRSWSEPIAAEMDMPEVSGYWPSPTSLQLDKDGSLLFAITGSLKESAGGGRMARLVWTKDLETFEVSPIMPVKGTETAAIPISGGKYFVTTRIPPKRLNMTYDRKSKQWSEATPFPAPHYWRCSVDLVSDGKFLYLATPTAGRTQGHLYRSADEGVTWDEVAQLNGDDHFGYSSLVVLENGDIGILAERARQKGRQQSVLADIVFHRIPVKP